MGPQVGARKSQRLARLRKNQQQQSGVSVSLLLFADDIVLTSCAENLQDMLQYSRRYRFDFNAKKSNVMVFSQQINSPCFYLGVDVLENTPHFAFDSRFPEAPP